MIRGLVKRRILRFHPKNRGSRFFLLAKISISLLFLFLLRFFLFSFFFFKFMVSKKRRDSVKNSLRDRLLKGEAHFPRNLDDNEFQRVSSTGH